MPTRVHADVPLPMGDEVRRPNFYLQLSMEQAYELQFGRVTGEVREMARLLVDETFEDLRKNAAKPVRQAKAAKPAPKGKTRRKDRAR